MDRNYCSGYFRFSRLDVALRKESVDRNMFVVFLLLAAGVALRKESVDRNLRSPFAMFRLTRRSPQGERG